MGLHLRVGLHLHLIDTRCMVKKHLDGKKYLFIVRQTFFDPNSDETFLVEYKIKCCVLKL